MEDNFVVNQERYKNHPQYNNLKKQFKEETKLEKADVQLLITAVILQVLRQYVVDPYLKSNRPRATSHDEIAKGNASPGWYRVPTDKILTNKVPFDTVRKSGKGSIDSILKGSKNHRGATLGHDPILGWVFGTANIMTGTITNYSFVSAHVKYDPISKQNIIHSKANTTLIYTSVKNRVFHEGIDGKVALAAALCREFQHLYSDVGTAQSLQIPLINAINPEIGRKLANYGINTAGVATEASLSVLINMIVSIIHRIMMPSDANERLYEVRTRKILLISNLIATSSNVIAVGVATYFGDRDAIKNLDVGGLIVTIMRLCSDIRFIKQVEEEFAGAFALRLNQLNYIDEIIREYVTELSDYDIAGYEKETNVYNEFSNNLSRFTTQNEIDNFLSDTYEQLELAFPWEGDFDEFMSDRSKRLVFK